MPDAVRLIDTLGELGSLNASAREITNAADPTAAGSLVTRSYLEEQISGIGGGAAQGTFLVSGGGVTWSTGYTYTVAAGTGYIEGVLYYWAQQNVTLDAADATYNRIDVIAVNTSSTIVKITGQASSSPSEPVVDPSTQLKLALVTVDAASSEPTVTTETVYADNAGSPAEWAWTTSGSGFNVASTTNPRTGSKDIEGTNVTANSYAQGQRGSGTIDPNTYEQLVFYVRFKATWNANRYLLVQLQNAGVKKGNALRISGGYFGLDGSDTTNYQAVIIPTLQFSIPSGTAINQIRFTDVGGAIGFYIDDVMFRSSGLLPNVVSGITQAEADARYSQLTHVHDAAAVTYTPTVLTDWDSNADPGDVDDALNQLAERVDDLEGAGGGGHTIQSAGTPMTARGNLNFTGAGVTVTDDSGNNATVVNIPSASSGNASDILAIQVFS